MKLRTLVIVLALLVLALVAGATIRAAGDAPTVLASGATVRFAEGVNFTVDVEAEAQVVEVKLSVRNANGGPWSYQYLPVEPAKRVRADYLLQTVGGNYVPPGAFIEYYFTVLDAEGNTTVTPRQSLRYTDPRFQWETLTVGSLELLYHDQPEWRVREVWMRLKDSLRRVEDILQSRPELTMRGVIYNNVEEVRGAFPSLSAATDEEQIFHGFAFSEWNLFAGIGLRANLITHEAAHLMLHSATEHAVQPIPSWLNEGFASYVERGSQTTPPRTLQAQSPSHMPLRSMQSVPGRVADIVFFYRKSESVVEHLLERHGEEKFRDLLYRFSEGVSINGALTAVYGFDQDGLEREWLSSDDGAGGGDTGMLWLQAESMLIGGVAFIVAVVVAFRFIRRRLAPQPPEDEGPHEDYLGPYGGGR